MRVWSVKLQRMNPRRVLVALLMGLVFASPVQMVWGQASGKGALIKATELDYLKFPHGRDSYRSRLLVTPGYLRFDDGQAASDYLLFDRRSRTIYSVDHEDHTILVIALQPVKVKPPMPLHLTEQHVVPHGAPAIDGRHAVHYTYYANHRRCVDVMVVPGLLDGVRKALMRFKETLAGQQAAVMDKTPLSMQSACSLADLIFSPTRTLRHGLPIMEWRPNGDRKELLNYHRAVSVAEALFQLPHGYRRYAIGANGMVPAPKPSASPGTIANR